MAIQLQGRHTPATQETPLHIRDIQWNTEQHCIYTGDTTIRLTITEYRLLFPLRHGLAVSYEELANLAYNYTADENVRVMMDKHIDRIRGKLRGRGIYVYCVLNYGYLLLPELPPRELPRTTKVKGKQKIEVTHNR